MHVNMRFWIYVPYQLAFDATVYGNDAGKWIVCTKDQKGNELGKECSRAMHEADAFLLARALNALHSANQDMNAYYMVSDNDEGGDLLHDEIRGILEDA